MRCNCSVTGNGRCRAEGNFAMPYGTECARELDEDNSVASDLLNGAASLANQVADTIVQIEIADTIGAVVEGAASVVGDIISSVTDD